MVPSTLLVPTRVCILLSENSGIRGVTEAVGLSEDSPWESYREAGPCQFMWVWSLRSQSRAS